MYKHAQTQDWVDREHYPFEDKFIELSAGRMHYVDEGRGETILFVHGTPTWSFLYRDFIKELSKNYRCVAIDHLGFGLSEKHKDLEGTPDAHAQNLSEFIDKLKLKEVTLIVHDFGGPIGLGAAIEKPERVKRIVMFNTWLWATENSAIAQGIDQFLRSDAGRAAYLEQNYSPVVLLKQAFADTSKLTEEVHQHYIRPFPTPDSRLGMLKIGKAFVGSSDWYQAQWNSLSVLEEKPWLIVWGNRDPFLNTEMLKLWKSRFPQAEVLELESGHFVQEESTEAAIAAISRFLAND